MHKATSHNTMTSNEAETECTYFFPYGNMYILQPFITDVLIFSFCMSAQFLWRPTYMTYTTDVWRRNPPYWTLQHSSQRTHWGSHVVADGFSSRRTGDVEPGLRSPLQSCRVLDSIVPIARLRLPPGWGRPWSLLRFPDCLWHPHTSAMPLGKGLPLLRLMPGAVHWVRREITYCNLNHALWKVAKTPHPPPSMQLKTC